MIPYIGPEIINALLEDNSVSSRPRINSFETTHAQAYLSGCSFPKALKYIELFIMAGSIYLTVRFML